MYEILYSDIADGLVENGYCIIKNTLSQELNETLLALCQDEQDFVKAGISSHLQAHVDNTKRSTTIRWLDEDGSAQSSFLEFAQGLELYLNRHLFLGLHYYESHFAIYDKGDFYEKHYDAFAHSKNRVITTVYYLNDSWKNDDGGELLLFDQTQRVLEKVLPHMGTFVVFLSEKFPHEVLATKRKRYSIAGWFRVDTKMI